MNKIEEILTAWGIAFNPNEKQSELAAKRIEICNQCENKSKVGFFNVCSLCGCALKAKVFSQAIGACPAGKWNEVDQQHIIYKKERSLRFVSAQPASLYYAWQVEVMLNNFIEMGVNLNQVDIVCWKSGMVPDEWTKLANNYAARFFFYEDTRETKNYISSIRPNILKQHFEAHSYLINDTIFYHDCDIIFTKPINDWITNEMINDDNWYGSDVRWYIGHDYIKSKGDDVLKRMCEISKIDEQLVKDNELNSIGAQYIMKNINSEFWSKVEKESEVMFYEITQLNNTKKAENPQYHELQIWCADMWAVLWNGWKMGVKTICHKNLDFSWGTSPIEEYHRCNIMHNAGVTNENGFFYKAKYMDKLPYDECLDVNQNTGSWNYWQWVLKTGLKSVLK